ncbi:MAG: hypothetical protein OEM02_12585 [Desulfobulbaceae bacterium]|nr:hypothetical protein [Desulfobulbaceae bacterium]
MLNTIFRRVFCTFNRTPQGQILSSGAKRITGGCENNDKGDISRTVCSRQ